MKKPNFFIIGAPRCGTTSLAAWLAEHPEVYMSPNKEPRFFSSDLNLATVFSRRAYDRLFDGASDVHKAVGEASTSYLYSKTAVPSIEREFPGARYIVMIRNPVDMAYSLHETEVCVGNEHVKDFYEAWKLSDHRAQGRFVKWWCKEPRWLDYKSVCKLGEQLERLFHIVPRERVLVVLLDDIKKDPRREYLRVLEFFGVQDDGRKEFPVLNPAQERRWPWLNRAVLLIGSTVRPIKRFLKMEGKGTGLLKAIDRANIKYRRRKPLDPNIQAELIKYFLKVKDIELLERLLGRDLSMWLEPEALVK